MKTCNPQYLERVFILSTEERERLLSRMSGKLPRKLAKEKISENEALALQLELEDEQLNEWRGRMHNLKAKELEKALKPSKDDKKPKAAATGKAIMKVVATVKAKDPTYPKMQTAPKSAAKPAKPEAPIAKPAAKSKHSK
jgi:hypothetical protein